MPALFAAMVVFHAFFGAAGAMAAWGCKLDGCLIPQPLPPSRECSGGCATSIAIQHATNGPCLPAGAFDLRGTEFQDRCAGFSSCNPIRVPPYRYWEFDAATESLAGAPLPPAGYLRANAGCSWVENIDAFINAHYDFGGPPSPVIAGLWTAFQASWLNPDGDGCPKPTGSNRTVFEVSKLDDAREGQVDHRSWYLLTAVDSVIAVAAGEAHSLALLADGTIWAWGSNEQGQLGDGGGGLAGAFEAVPVPVQFPVGAPRAVAITAGGFHSLALGADGQVWAWGDNGRGQLGVGAAPPWSPVPVALFTIWSWRNLSAGFLHSVAVDGAGGAWAWGANSFGQLGDGPTTDRDQPAPVLDGQQPGQPPLLSAVSVSAGGGHALALLGSGVVWSWGANGSGQLGTGSFVPSSLTLAMPSQATAMRAVCAGGQHSLAVDEGGAAWAWGWDFYGQLGNNQWGAAADSASPVAVLDLALGQLGAVEGLGAGNWHSVGRLADGLVDAWGDNSFGELGNDQVTFSAVAFPLDDFDVVPPDQGNIVKGVKELPDVHLHWPNGPPGIRLWRVLLDFDKRFQSPPLNLADPRVTDLLHSNAVNAVPDLYFYRVVGLSPYCFTPGP